MLAIKRIGITSSNNSNTRSAFQDIGMYAVIETTDNNFYRYWNQLVENDPLQNPLYTPARAVADLARGEYSDRSFLILDDDEPVFGCSMTLHTDEQGRRCLGYFGIEASMLVNRHSMRKPSNNFSPRAVQLLQAHFCQLIEELRPDALEYLDLVSCGLMSPVTQVLLERGGRPTVCKSRLINLALSRRALLSLISEPYRRLIAWGQDNLELDVLTGRQAANAETRFAELFETSRELLQHTTFTHWQTCHELMLAGKGFMVRARQSGYEPATALFIHNNHTSYYVIDDTVLDTSRRPVLHSMLWQAINYGKELGCRQFDMGCVRQTPQASDTDSDDTRELDPDRFGGTPQTRLKVSLVQSSEVRSQKSEVREWS